MTNTPPRNCIIALIAIAILAPTFVVAEFAARKGEFRGNLDLRDVAGLFEDSGEYDPGHTEFSLLAPYTYVDRKGRSWTVPQGSVVNGTSIPRIVWSVIGGPWSGKYRNAAVIHDWMCEEQVLSSKEVHRIFYEALEDSNVDPRTAWIMFRAVELGGPQWEENQFDGTQPEIPGLSKSQLDKIIEEADTRFK